MALHALFTVAFVRVHFAFHWPSDVLAGAAIGVVMAVLLLGPLCRLIERTRLRQFGERHSEWIHPVLFLVLFEIVTMLDSTLEILDGLGELLT